MNGTCFILGFALGIYFVGIFSPWLILKLGQDVDFINAEVERRMRKREREES